MLLVGILIICVGIALIYLALPGGKLWRNYLDDIAVSFKATEREQATSKRFTKETMQELPEQIQKHIENGGYLNQPLMSNMHIRFYNTKFRMSEDKEPMAIDFQQVNFVERPDRHAFLTGRMFGLPIQAKDSTIDGVGSMTGILAKQIQLFRSTGPEMDQGQLITALADAVFMPALFLQDFVSWTIIDEQTVEGQIAWQGVSAKGQFTFDEHGNIARFDTEDRYRDDNGKSSKLVPWFVTYERYQKQGGHWLPGHVKVNWVMPNGEYTYFESDNMEVDFSVAKDQIG
ncbi:hypothetical protein A5888_001719 [Enterococcus sp. 9E7_DIV0242]|uniref:Uncharacterized protein n=2 Tax=Candidatus Enterococcus clewellii TaxID=1834193 RepID=A0A242K3P8_9ENTE|nr:hypothetical protein A5888_003096 [Enterococcus sp. 9E7_DIV0242]